MVLAAIVNTAASFAIIAASHDILTGAIVAGVFSVVNTILNWRLIRVADETRRLTRAPRRIGARVGDDSPVILSPDEGDE